MPFFKDKRKLKSRCNELINQAKRNSLRHSIFTSYGDRYKGEWGNDTKEGNGVLLSRTNKLYEGEWVNNFRHGFGCFSWRQENKTFILDYRGEWSRGVKCGLGAYHYLDGSFYLGYFKNNKRHGYGKMWYIEGYFYEGDWIKDKRHGLGIWVRPDGNRYEGAWAFDLKHGKGRFFHLDNGQMQEGVWKNDFCVYSFIIDIPFKQTAAKPTPYPIQTIELLEMEKVCQEHWLDKFDIHQGHR